MRLHTKIREITKGILFQQEAVRISSSFRSKNGQNQAEKESKDCQSHAGNQAFFANVSFPISRISHQNHSQRDESVQKHDEVGFQHKLALRAKDTLM